MLVAELMGSSWKMRYYAHGVRRATLLVLCFVFVINPVIAGTIYPRIEIRNAVDGVTVDYWLNKPVDRLKFTRFAIPDGSDIITVPGIILDKDSGSLAGPQPTSHFRLHIRPAAAVASGVNPMLTDLGQGAYVLYAPYILPADGELYTVHDLSRTRTRWRSNDRELEGYVLLNAKASKRHGYKTYASSRTAIDFRTVVRVIFPEAMRWYRGELGPLADIPLLVILDERLNEDMQHQGKWGLSGSVTGNHVMFLQRLRPLNHRSVPDINHYRRLISHEAFHYWNMGQVLTSSDRSGWLKEGGASYAAVLFTGRYRSSGPSASSGVEVPAEEAIRKCSSPVSTDDGAISGRQEAFKYDCGTLIQALAVSYDGSCHSCEERFFSLWRYLLAIPGGYKAEDFLAYVRATNPGGFVRIIDIIRANSALSEGWPPYPDVGK